MPTSPVLYFSSKCFLLLSGGKRFERLLVFLAVVGVELGVGKSLVSLCILVIDCSTNGLSEVSGTLFSLTLDSILFGGTGPDSNGGF